ncbi:MAG: prepilin-type N-terminal cleavage/methylation domain-containing protein [Nitrospiraceae bacterium]|nr:MAG: prepilin-type N-terminal cleavage/methylation domain-containing protein [Nitrospiraceae bacterium]
MKNGVVSNDDGFTLFEVIVATAIMAVSLVMVMQLFSAGLRSARASCDYTRAVVHARDKMEELSYTLKGASGEFEDGFSWETAVEDYRTSEDKEYSLLKLVVKIYWPDVQQKQKAHELVSLKMNEVKKNQ